MQVVIQKEKMDELSTATLAAWLFDLSPGDSEILHGQLSDPKIGSANPLRVLELKTVSELGQILPKVKGFGRKTESAPGTIQTLQRRKNWFPEIFSVAAGIFFNISASSFVTSSRKFSSWFSSTTNTSTSVKKKSPREFSIEAWSIPGKSSVRSHQKPGGSDCLRTQSPFRRSQSLGGRYSNHATLAGGGEKSLGYLCWIISLSATIVISAWPMKVCYEKPAGLLFPQSEKRRIRRPFCLQVAGNRPETPSFEKKLTGF